MGEKGNEFQLGYLGRWFLQVKQPRRVQEVEPLLKQILSQELTSDPQGRGELGRSQGDLWDSKGFREQGCCWLEAGIRAGKWESPARSELCFGNVPASADAMESLSCCRVPVLRLPVVGGQGSQPF